MEGEVQETAVPGEVATVGASRAMQHVGPQIKRPSYQHYPVSALPQEGPGSTKWSFSGELAMAAITVTTLVTVASLGSATWASAACRQFPLAQPGFQCLGP